MNKNVYAAVLATVAALAASPAVAQVQSIVSPSTRVAVPVSGAAIALPYKAVPNFPPCGPFTHRWKRDNSTEQTCNGAGCSVTYYESAATRGSHVATDQTTGWFLVGSPSMYCIPYETTLSRSYVVQYAPTAQFISAPTALAVNEGANFFASGTTDPDFSEGPVTYKLNFGDGTQFAGSAGYYFYTAPGTYVVTFTVDDGRFKATAQHTVYVYGDQPCGFGDELICQ
jgi:hypothetical protein